MLKKGKSSFVGSLGQFCPQHGIGIGSWALTLG